MTEASSRSFPARKRRFAGPPIAPVPSGTGRPFWSVMIPTTGRTDYLDVALRSVLAQGVPPEQMQIEVVCNSLVSAPAQGLVHQLGRGRITLFCQPEPVSMAANWNTCLQRAHGHWIHLMHDDDALLAGFYEVYRQFIERHPDVALVFNRVIEMDERGAPLEPSFTPPEQDFTGLVTKGLEKLSTHCFLRAPTVVARRNGYERQGGFTDALHCATDWEMWIRLAECGAVGYLHEPHFLYRLHAQSGTNHYTRDGTLMHEILEVAEDAIARQPALEQPRLRSTARWIAAGTALQLRATLKAEGRHAAALKHACLSWRLRPTRATLLLGIRDLLRLP